MLGGLGGARNITRRESTSDRGKIARLRFIGASIGGRRLARASGLGKRTPSTIELLHVGSGLIFKTFGNTIDRLGRARRGLGRAEALRGKLTLDVLERREIAIARAEGVCRGGVADERQDLSKFGRRVFTLARRGLRLDYIRQIDSRRRPYLDGNARGDHRQPNEPPATRRE